jgi:hypothetical protein
MFNDLVARARGGHIQLPFENARQSTYYIPASAFLQAWNAELSFELINREGNMQIILPARAIDLNNNDTIIDVGAAIRRDRFEDYLVRFNVNWTNQPYIQGEETLTPVADVRIDLVATTGNVVAWERGVADNLRQRMTDIYTDDEIREYVRNAVREEVPAEDISREMVYIVEIMARRALARMVNDELRRLTQGSRNHSMSRLDQSMAISAITSPDISAVEAYQALAGGLWSNVSTMQVGVGQGIFTSQFGQFVFTGRAIRIEDIHHVVGGPVATGIVARHGLDDFLGRGNIDIHRAATRMELINSVARMMGAPRGADSVRWLRYHNVDIVAAGAHNPISYQSALHLIMQVYEATTGTRADSLRITNFNLVNGLPGLEGHYRTSVGAAIELGLVDGNSLQPTAILTVGRLLEILAALDGRIGL